MQVTLLHGYPDLVGRRRLVVANGVGPKSYTQYNATTGAGGDGISGLPFQFYIDSIPGFAVSTDGTTIAIPMITAIGARQTWKFRYYSFTNGTPAIGAEINASTDLSGKSFQFFLIGGTY